MTPSFLCLCLGPWSGWSDYQNHLGCCYRFRFLIPSLGFSDLFGVGSRICICYVFVFIMYCERYPGKRPREQKLQPFSPPPSMSCWYLPITQPEGRDKESDDVYRSQPLGSAWRRVESGSGGRHPASVLPHQIPTIVNSMICVLSLYYFTTEVTGAQRQTLKLPTQAMLSSTYEALILTGFVLKLIWPRYLSLNTQLIECLTFLILLCSTAPFVVRAAEATIHYCPGSIYI